MENIRRQIAALVDEIKTRGGACIIFVDPDGKGGNVSLTSEGYEKSLAAMIGTAVLSCEDMREYITKGVEAAQYVIEERRKEAKNDKTDC